MNFQNINMIKELILFGISHVFESIIAILMIFGGLIMGGRTISTIVNLDIFESKRSSIRFLLSLSLIAILMVLLNQIFPLGLI
jgi:uncharacterized Tic20 family protein